MKKTHQTWSMNLGKLSLLLYLIITCISCTEEKFDPQNPDVGQFVKEIKTGSYKTYEKGETGKDLWLLMPQFTESHIQGLLSHASDTTHIKVFPSNPAISVTPFPQDRDYLFLGEYLLWCVEGIRLGSEYASLVPFIRYTSSPNNSVVSLKADDLQMVSQKYDEWWEKYKDGDLEGNDPLEGTGFNW